MPIMPGTLELGPDTGSLRIETKRGGAAAKAGHDLVIGVRSWRATLVIGDDPAGNSLALSADSGSMEVLEGTGGVMTLTDEDKAEIKKTLEEETLESYKRRYLEVARKARENLKRGIIDLE